MAELRVPGLSSELSEKLNELVASGQVKNFTIKAGNRYCFDEPTDMPAFPYKHDHTFDGFVYVIGGMKLVSRCGGTDCKNLAQIRANNLYGKDSPKTEELCAGCFDGCLPEHKKGYSGFRIVSAVYIKDSKEIEIPPKDPFKMTTEQSIIGPMFRPAGSDFVVWWDPQNHRMHYGLNKPGAGLLRPIEHPKYSTAPNATAAKKLAREFFTEGL